MPRKQRMSRRGGHKATDAGRPNSGGDAEKSAGDACSDEDSYDALLNRAKRLKRAMNESVARRTGVPIQGADGGDTGAADDELEYQRMLLEEEMHRRGDTGLGSDTSSARGGYGGVSSDDEQYDLEAFEEWAGSTLRELFTGYPRYVDC